jgi:hypothetical protein
MDAQSATESTDSGNDDGFEWAVVEIFGRRHHAGRTREEERFGAKMLRVDVPKLEWVEEDGERRVVVTGWATHFYGGGAIFSFSLTDEASVMKSNRPYDPPSRLTYRPAEEDEDARDGGEADGF